jgi:hypothetical protein
MGELLIPRTLRIPLSLDKRFRSQCVRQGDVTHYTKEALTDWCDKKEAELKPQEPPKAVVADIFDKECLDFCFDQFWGSGIRKVNKKKARPLFVNVLKKHSDANKPTPYDFTNMLVNDVEARLNSNQLGFSEMHPTTYLNGERWNDEAEKQSGARKPSTMDNLTDTKWAQGMVDNES